MGKSSPAVMTTVPLIQYKPGDLGLIPTPRASGTPVFQRLSQVTNHHKFIAIYLIVLQ